jgi:hypothetical protein
VKFNQKPNPRSGFLLFIVGLGKCINFEYTVSPQLFTKYAVNTLSRTLLNFLLLYNTGLQFLGLFFSLISSSLPWLRKDKVLFKCAPCATKPTGYLHCTLGFLIISS